MLIEYFIAIMTLQKYLKVYYCLKSFKEKNYTFWFTDFIRTPLFVFILGLVHWVEAAMVNVSTFPAPEDLLG